MRYTPILFAMFFTLPCLVFGQKEPMKFGKVPQEDLDMKVYEPDTSAAAVVLGDFGQVAFQFKENDVLYRFSRHKRIKILKRSGFDQGDIIIPFYSKGKMEDIRGLKVSVITPDGAETDVSKGEIFEEKVNEYWSRKRFSCPNLTEGAIIDYRYDIISTAIFQLPDWYFQEDIPVRWSELRLEIPEWYDYVFISQGRPVDIKEQDTGAENFYVQGGFGNSGAVSAKIAKARFVMKDVPALKAESFITTMDDYYARIRFQLSLIKYPNSSPKPIMSSWQKVAEDLWKEESFGLQLSKNRNYNKAWEAVQPQLTGVATDEEKIAVIYQYLTSNLTREDGSGVYVRKDLNDCFEKKSARGHEMNLLMIALLNEAGISARPVLVSTRSHGRPMPLYPLMDQFDHVMALVSLGEKNTLLDVANPFRPMGYPAVNSLNSQAWIADKTAPQWIDVLPPSGSDTYLFQLTLTENGALDGQFTMSCDGYSAVNEREQLHDSPAGDYLKKSFAEKFPDSKLDSLSFENQEDLAKPFKAKAFCHLPDRAQISGDFIYLSPSLMSAFNENPFKLEQRTYPVDIPYPLKERIIVNLDLPAGYVVEELPEPVKISLPGDAGMFHYQLSENSGKLQLISSLQINDTRFEPEEYGALRNFFSMVEEKLGEQVVLKRRE